MRQPLNFSRVKLIDYPSAIVWVCLEEQSGPSMLYALLQPAHVAHYVSLRVLTIPFGHHIPIQIAG